MSSNIDNWISQIEKIYIDKGFHYDIAAINAKALLTEISEEGSRKWKYSAPHVVRNLSLGTFALETIAQNESSLNEKLRGAALDFARTWESLAILQESTSKQIAIIKSAINYELAGYQANAACLAKQLCRQLGSSERPSLLDLASNFLRRRMLQSFILSQATMIEPLIDKNTPGIVQYLALAAAGKAFSEASLYFLNGNKDHIVNALEFFDKSQYVYDSLERAHESGIISSIRKVLPMMAYRSTWAYFEGLNSQYPLWKRYLMLLARGTGANILDSTSVSELWPSQLAALSGRLFESRSKVIRMPTSAGKTRVAELAMANTLITSPGAKCVYIAPYRALVGELEETFINIFGDLGFKVSTIVDDAFSVDPFEELLIEEGDILVMTPEKLDLLQRAKPEYLENVQLFILDEGHVVNERERGVKFELLLSRFKRKIPKARFIFLSAVVPQETLEDFAEWLNADRNDMITTDWRPSIARKSFFEWDRQVGKINYVEEEDKLNEYVHGVIRKNEFVFRSPKGRRISRVFPDGKSKSQTAAELALKFSELGSVLVFCTQPNYVTSVGKALLTRMEYGLKTGNAIITNFDPQQTLSVPAAQEWLGPDHEITNMLSNGIGIHFGSLPDVVRKSVETDFRKKRFKVMVSTNTLAQGVNLPIRTVIIHSCWRYIQDEWKRIPARDYWNIAGRAGRAGEETQGLLIHITHNDADKDDFQFYLDRRTNVEAVKSVLYQFMLELIEGRISDEDLFRYLDAEILAILAEEGIQFFSEENIHNIFNETLVHVQAKQIPGGTKPLQKAFQIVAGNIAVKTDPINWRIFSSTGLSSTSCDLVKQHVLANEEQVRTALTSANSSEILIHSIVEECMKLPEMEPRKELNLNFTELLAKWLSGTSIRDIIEQYQEEGVPAENISAYIEDVFSYRLPWGVSGFIQIAADILSIDHGNITEYAKFFPSMIKYGVPTPKASWAISSGIPFRDVAMRIADSHARKTESSNYSDFAGYLSKLTEDDLNSEFKLKSPFLEEVAKTLSKSSTNVYLRPFEVNIFPLRSWVNGIRYVSGSSLASIARVDDTVTFSRDYDNLDRNAIYVKLGDKPLGYIEKTLAQRIAPEIDSGSFFRGKIVSIESRNIPDIEILIEKHAELSDKPA